MHNTVRLAALSALVATVVAETSVTADAPAATYTVTNSDGVGAGSNVYKHYSGDGSTNDGWPAISEWVSFDDMFNNNKDSIFQGCAQYNAQAMTNDEVGWLYNSIQAIAAASNVDHRFILAEILQESTGCARVDISIAGGGGPTIYNPGLLQSFDGYYTCNCERNDEYNEKCGLVYPCPQATMTGMISEGIMGTNAGDGFARLMNLAQQHGTTGAQTFYVAAEWYYRGYNDPEVGGDLGNYAIDVANYLTGWLGGSS